MTTTTAPTPRFDTFYRHDELTKLLFEYAQAFPTLAAIRSIGKSFEGRDIWVATITNSADRRGRGQAGVLDRRQHPRRRADGAAPRCCTSCNELAHQATATTPTITQLLDTRTVYLCPRLNPDGAELALADQPAPHPLVARGAIRSTKNRSTA